MKLISLTLEGYRQFLQPTTIPFGDGLIGISGPNGAGKSKLVEAMLFALFGPTGTLPPKDTKEDLPSLAAAGAHRTRVELAFAIGGQDFKVTREPNRAELYVGSDSRPQVSTPSQVTMYVRRLLRLNPATFQGTFVARQKDVAGFQSLDPAPRKRLMNHLLGVAQVEKAIALADEELRQRRDRVRQLETNGISVDEARARLEKARGDVETAESEEETLAERVSAAESDLERARGRLDQLRSVERAITSFGEQISALAGARKAWAGQALQARQDLHALDEQDQQAAALKATAAECESAEAECDIHERLQNLAHAQSEVAALQRELADPLARRLADRRGVEREITDLGDRLAEIREELVTRKEELAAAKTAQTAAHDRLAKVERQRATAERLGPDGECEACGGTLGERLETVLQHLADETEELRRAAETQQHAAAEAADAVSRLEREERRARGRQEMLTARRDGELATIEGEIAAKQEILAERRRRLEAAEASVPAGSRGQEYDAVAHRDAQARAERHRSAMTRLATIGDLAARRGESEGKLWTSRGELRRHSAERRRLAGLRSTAADQARALAHVPREVDEATAALDEAHELQRAAIGARGAARERRDQATEQFDASVRNAADVAAAKRALVVCEQTRELLLAVYDALSSEARPELEQLMEVWMPSVLGSRFRAVKLSDDFAVQADNGSGLHYIGHFSGGEQTVLAIMLRVAVALFCRERAGLDAGFLVLDEVFGDQDQQRRHLLVQFLEEIKGHFDQILIVNHIEEITGQLDAVIRVIPSGDNESRVEVSR